MSLAIFGLLIASVAVMPRLSIDLSVIPLLEASEEVKAEVEAFGARFPDQKIDLPIVLEWPDPIGRAELLEVERFGQKILELPHAAHVLSLATTEIIVHGDGAPHARNFMEIDPEGLALDRVARHPLIRGRLLSRDGRSAVILIGNDIALGESEPRRDFLEAVEQLVNDEAPSNVVVHILGGTIIERVMNRYIIRDMVQSVAIESLFFIILLPLMFRTIRGMILPLVTIFAAVVLNFGFMSIAGRSINALGVAIPGLVIVIALCDAIHMMHRFEEAYMAHGNRRRAITEMMQNVGQACVFTSMTTAMGFFSLIVARHAAVRDFAISMTFGVGFAFLSVITILPLALSFWPMRAPHREGMAFLDRFAYGRRGLTVALFTGAICIAAIGCSRIVVESTWLGELPQRDRVVVDMLWYEENFQGLFSLEAEIGGPLDSVAAFRAFDALEQRIVAEPDVTGVESYASWVREMAGDPDPLTDADVRSGLRILKLTGESFPRHLMMPDFREGRIVFRTTDIGTKRFIELKSLFAEQAERLPTGLTLQTTGYSEMAWESSHLIVVTLFQSLVLSLVSISVFIMLSYRSVRLGLISILPNLLPIIAALGMAGWIGIPLRIGILMVFCAGMGLAVDDTIHLITRFLQERRLDPRASMQAHLQRSLRSTGKALVITTVVLAAGGVSYMPSNFKSISDAGLLLATIVIVALLTDLFLLPIMLERFYPKTIEEASAEQGARVVDEPPATR